MTDFQKLPMMAHIRKPIGQGGEKGERYCSETSNGSISYEHFLSREPHHESHVETLNICNDCLEQIEKEVIEAIAVLNGLVNEH